MEFGSIFRKIINTINIGAWNSARYLENEYIRISDLLKKYLTDEQIQFIPKVHSYPYSLSSSEKTDIILQLKTACGIAISYLHSLEMDLDKDLSIKREELKLKEKEIESYKKLFKDSLEVVKQYPELQRSRTVEETKKSHRGIEEHSRNDN